jgi:hypothetical protein
MSDLEDRKIPGESIPIDALKHLEAKKKRKKELQKKAYYELRKKEREQLIAEMILYCSPEVSGMNQYSEQHSLKKEKVKKRANRKRWF